MLRDVCYGTIMLKDGQHERNAAAANNYASSLLNLERFEEAKALLRKTMPVAQHFLGNRNEITLYLRWSYAQSLRCADCATLDDLREAVTILEETASNFRRVLGGAHPRMAELERALRQSRAALLEAWECDPASYERGGVGADTLPAPLRYSQYTSHAAQNFLRAALVEFMTTVSV